MKYKCTVLEVYNPFHTLVKLFHAEDVTNEKNRTLELLLETNNVKTNLEFRNLFSETNDLNRETFCTQTTDPKKTSKPYFRKNCSFVKYPTTMFQTVFENNEKMGKREWNKSYF